MVRTRVLQLAAETLTRWFFYIISIVSREAELLTATPYVFSSFPKPKRPKVLELLTRLLHKYHNSLLISMLRSK